MSIRNYTQFILEAAMTILTRIAGLRSFVVCTAFWMSFAFLIPARPFIVHAESAVRHSAPTKTGNKASISCKESFFLVHLTANSGFSFATANYSGSIDITSAFPDGNIPANSNFFMYFNNSILNYGPSILVINFSQGVNADSGKFSILGSPFAADPVFDLGASNGVPPPKNFATGDPTFAATFTVKKSKPGDPVMMSFKIVTFARAGGNFNDIQGYVPSLTYYVNTGGFATDDKGAFSVDQVVHIGFGRIKQSVLNIVPVTGSGKRIAKHTEFHDYKIAGTFKGSI